MSCSAVIRLGPVIGAADLWHPERLERDRWHYHAGALRLPDSGGVPLVVNHDTEQKIGVVDELFEQRDDEGLSLYCRAVVFDRAEHWVRRGTAASVCFEERDAIDLPGGAVLFTAGLVEEITLAKGEPARERSAMVVSVSPIKRKWEPVAEPERVAATPPARTPSEPEWRDEINRRTDAAIATYGPDVDLSPVFHGYKLELGLVAPWRA